MFDSEICGVPLDSMKMDFCKRFPNCQEMNCKKLHINFNEYPCFQNYNSNCFRNRCAYSHKNSKMERYQICLRERITQLQNEYTIGVSFQINSRVVQSLERLNANHGNPHFASSLTTLLFYFTHHQLDLALAFDSYLPFIKTILTSPRVQPFTIQRWLKNTSCFETIVPPLLGILTSDSFIKRMTGPIADQVYNTLADLMDNIENEYFDDVTDIVESGGLHSFHSVAYLQPFYYPIALTEVFYPIFKALSMIPSSCCVDNQWSRTFKKYIDLFRFAQCRNEFSDFERTIIRHIDKIVEGYMPTSVASPSCSSKLTDRVEIPGQDDDGPPLPMTPSPSISKEFSQVSELIESPSNRCKVNFDESSKKVSKMPTKSAKLSQKQSEKMSNRIKKGAQATLTLGNKFKCEELFDRIKSKVEKGEDIQTDFEELLDNESELLLGATDSLIQAYKYLESASMKYLRNLYKEKKSYQRNIEKLKLSFLHDFENTMAG